MGNTMATLVDGLGPRCAKWKIHENLRFSESATCFHCNHFHQEMDDEGETPWSLKWDDQGTCLIGMTNAGE